jgi:hypothetical protein
LTRFFFSFTAVIARLSTFGDDHILTKCATQNLEYVINKKKSIASTEKKGKGKKIVEVKNIKVEKEKSGVKNEVKQTDKEVTEVEKNKETYAATTAAAAESKARRMRSTKSINAKEVVSTNFCC